LREYTTDDGLTLEVGAGPGQYAFVTRGRYVALDRDTAPYRPDLPRIVDVAGDALALPFASSVFDVVFFAHTFLSIPRQDIALAEARRVLRPRGRLLIFDYTRPTQRVLAPGYIAAGEHISVLHASEWRDLLHRSGFQDIGVRINSPSWRENMAHRLLPSPLYFAIVDRLPGSLVVAARN
jgi:SAM-dependent methyltransferase